MTYQENPTARHPQASRRLTLLLLALTLAVAAVLRLTALDLMEYKKDEGDMVQLISKVVDDGVIITHGQRSSMGPHQSPLATYFLAPAWAASRDPLAVVWWIGLMNVAAVGVTYWIGRRYISARAGLIAAACHAVSPWAVVFSRKIWLQNMVPLFSGLLMASALALIVEDRRRSVFWVCLLAGVVGQVYFAGYLAAAAVLVALALYRPRISTSALVFGLALLGLLSAPYLVFLAGGGWRELLVLLPEGAAPGAFTPNLKQLEPLWSLVNLGNLDHLIGNTSYYLDAKLGVAGVLVHGVAALERWIFIGGSGWLLWRMLFARGEPGSFRPTALLLALYMALPAAVWLLSKRTAPPHYYIATLPAPFLVVGMTVEEGLRRFGSRGGAPSAYRVASGLAGLALAGVVLTQVHFTGRLLALIGAGGGASGEYGVAYRHKASLADHLAERYGPGCYELAHQWRPLGVYGTGHFEMDLLVRRRASPGSCPAPDPAKLYLLEVLDQPISPEADERLRPYRRFGPILLYKEGASRRP